MHARVSLALLALAAASPLDAGSGGPDGGGYFWRDSREPGASSAAQTWTGPAVTLNLTDQSVQAVTLPFAFPFYGLAPASTVWVSDNGWLSLLDPAGNSAPDNLGLPDAAAPRALIAAYWDDLDPSSGFVQHADFAGGHSFFIRATQKSDGALVQWILELYQTGRIRILWYLTGGPTMSIGLQDETGTRGTQLRRDGTSDPGFALASDYAVEFLPRSGLTCPGGPGPACGTTSSLTTASGTALVSAYGCAPGSFGGRELVIPLDVATVSSLDAAISGFAPRNLALFFLGSCHELLCSAGGGSSISQPALRPGRYYLVIDGATLADDGPFRLTLTCGPPRIALHSGWRENRGEPLVPVSPPFATRGDPAEFAYASFPSIGDPGWQPTPDPNFVNFNVRSTICGRACGSAVEFTYYRTCLWLPGAVSDLTVSASHVDDGIAVRINGSVVAYGQLGPFATGNLAGNPALVTGALNDIEVIHSDDCCNDSRLESLTFTVDGRNALADWVESCQVTAAALPAASTVCAGTSVRLDASPSSSPSCSQPLEYRWREGSVALGPFSTDPRVTVTPLASTTYTVDVLCPVGCGCQSSADVAVAVSPAIGHGVPSRVPLCTGGTADLGGAPTASGGTPPLSYSWMPPSFLDDPLAANPRANPPATTTYTLEVTDAAGCRLTTTETVEVGGALPGDVGNTLRAVRAGGDAAFSWSAVLDATSYNLRGDAAKDFATSGVLINVAATGATDGGAVSRPPALLHYRVRAVGCPGEGP